MVLRDSLKVSNELDKLILVEPGEFQIAHLKFLVARGDDKAHIEGHMDFLEVKRPTLDTRAVRSAI